METTKISELPVVTLFQGLAAAITAAATVVNTATTALQATALKAALQWMYADSAYTGEYQTNTIETAGIVHRVRKKGYRYKPLTDSQKANNRSKSSVRSRVGRVFGFMEQSMHGIKCECVGIAHASGILGLMNLTCNLFRYEHIVRLGLLNIKCLWKDI